MDPDDIAVADGAVHLRRADGTWTPADEKEALAAAMVLLGEGLQRLPAPSEAFVQAVDRYLAPVKGKFNYDDMRHTYLDASRFQRWVHVIDVHKDVRGARVLSSGCGVGGSIVSWWAGGAADVVGLEIDPALAEMAALRVEGLPGARAELYDGRVIPLDDGSIDIIESVDVLEHVPWPDDYLAELRRVLAPGGVVLLVTPNRLWPIEQHTNVPGPMWLSIERANRLYPRWARYVKPLSSDLAWRMERVPTVREFNVSFRILRGMAKRHGFRLETIGPAQHGAAWPLPPSPLGADRLAQHRLGKFVAPTRHLAALLWAA